MSNFFFYVPDTRRSFRVPLLCQSYFSLANLCKSSPTFRVSNMSPNARMARIASLESMVSISSNTLVAMASQLSEAEERERAFTGRSRWNQLRSMAEAKNLLQYAFNIAVDSRLVFLPGSFSSISMLTLQTH